MKKLLQHSIESFSSSSQTDLGFESWVYHSLSVRHWVKLSYYSELEFHNLQNENNDSNLHHIQSL